MKIRRDSERGRKREQDGRRDVKVTVLSRCSMERLKEKMETSIQSGLVFRNERRNGNFTTDFIYQLYSEEGKGVFDCTDNILGHMHQGGAPSPFERKFDTKMAAKAMQWLTKKVKEFYVGGRVFANTEDSACLLGIRSRTLLFHPDTKLKEDTDFEHLIQEQWWRKPCTSMKILAKYKKN